MSYSQYIDKSQEISDLAIARIEKDDLFPIPENYELWFAYFANAIIDLNNAVDDYLKDNKGKLSNEQCISLFDEFLSGKREEKAVIIAGYTIKNTISDINVAVYSAKENAEKYSGKLKSANEVIRADSSKGDLGDLLDNIISDTDDMIEYNKDLEEMLDYSNKLMEDMRRDLEVARQEAMTDTLTGLANRKAFDLEIVRLIGLSNDENDPHTFSMILLDIDNFKDFNDNFGHQIGDQVLKLISRTLKDGIKGRDLAVRYGGEEFAIFLPETNITGSFKIAEILRKEVESRELINRATGKKIAKITFSAGVAEYYKNEPHGEFIERIDKALYKAKESGRNHVEVSK